MKKGGEGTYHRTWERTTKKHRIHDSPTIMCWLSPMESPDHSIEEQLITVEWDCTQIPFLGVRNFENQTDGLHNVYIYHNIYIYHHIYILRNNKSQVCKYMEDEMNPVDYSMILTYAL